MCTVPWSGEGLDYRWTSPSLRQSGRSSPRSTRTPFFAQSKSGGDFHHHLPPGGLERWWPFGRDPRPSLLASGLPGTSQWDPGGSHRAPSLSMGPATGFLIRFVVENFRLWWRWRSWYREIHEVCKATFVGAQEARPGRPFGEEEACHTRSHLRWYSRGVGEEARARGGEPPRRGNGGEEARAPNREEEASPPPPAPSRPPHPLGCRSIFSILFEEGRSIRLRQLLFRFAAAFHFLGIWNLGPHHDWWLGWRWWSGCC